MNRAFLVRQAQAAAALGHQLEIEQYGQGGVKFRAMCSCGYASTARRNHSLALGAGFHHLGGVVSARKTAGGTLPPAPSVSVPRSDDARL